MHRTPRAATLRRPAAWFFLALLPLAGACGRREAGPAGETTLQRIQRLGTARVGYANEAPYAYVDRRTGELTGEAPEIARKVLEQLGVEEIEGVLTEFGSLIPGLKAGRFDLIAAGMYITPERCREVRFTRPTYGIGEAFLVPAGNPLGLHGYGDVVQHPTARLGVVAGTVERGWARALGVPDERVVVFPDPPSAVSGVQVGRVDAYAGTRLTVADLLAKAEDDGIEQAEPFTDPVLHGRALRGYGAFAVRKGDDDLLQALDRELQRFIGSEEHLRLVEPFGFTAEDLPGEVTAQQLCAR